MGSAEASVKELVTVAQENSTNQTADVLVKDQLWSPLDLITVAQERELHNPNNRTERRPFILLQHSTLNSNYKTEYERAC